MNNVDKVSRDAKLLVESAHDATVKNILQLNQEGSLALSSEDLEKLLTVVKVSVNEGYQKALPFFQHSVKSYL